VLRPPSILPIAADTNRGSSATPAMRGLLPLTIWKWRGRLYMAMKFTKPLSMVIMTVEVYTRRLSRRGGKMVEIEWCEAKSSQAKRIHQHRHPTSSGARDIAVPQEFGLRPARWKAKTTRTEAAMRRKEPKKSSCLQERRTGCFTILSLGQVSRNSTTVTTPTGPLQRVSSETTFFHNQKLT